jgi:1,4-alpha-glucan branching enzyme
MAKDVGKKSSHGTKPATAEPTAEPTAVLPELHPGLIRSLVDGVHPQPHETLGQHAVDGGFVIRTVRPLAEAVTAIRADGSRVALEHVADGLWQGFAPGGGQAYRLETSYSNGPDWVSDDPYRFVPSVGEVDLYLWGQGRHEQLWQVFGAHYRPHEDVEGTSFSVWAPHATAARVLGDFNSWNGVGHAMRRLSDTGVWELFIPGLDPGTTYKFELRTTNGDWVTRADPMARSTRRASGRPWMPWPAESRCSAPSDPRGSPSRRWSCAARTCTWSPGRDRV